MSMTEKKTAFRKYVAASMAAGTIAAMVYGWLAGLIDTTEAGLGAGTIIGLAAKYLWEENAS